MSTEQNKEIVRRMIDATVTGDKAALYESLHPDFVSYLPDETQDRDTFVRHLDATRLAFSDGRFTVAEQVAEGDRVMTWTTWHATHSGDFQGLPASHKQIAVSAVFIQRFQDGQIVENRSLFDQLSLMKQLGVIPAPRQVG